jgi:hypothetical protein
MEEMRDEDTKEMKKNSGKKQMSKDSACLILQFYKDLIFNA